MEARLEIKIEDAGRLCNALKPEIGKKGKVCEKIYVEGGDLIIKLYSKDIGGLKAGLNTYLDLIRLCLKIRREDNGQSTSKKG
jgi:tRNA threonylcarbamoyladenosine modification (KEOPS) complex  Pcc1 subunit